MKIKKSLSKFFLSTLCLLQTTSIAFAQLNEDGTYTHGDEDVATLGWIETLAENILSVALQLIGVVAFIMLLVGGIKILTSGGNPEAMESGKKTLTMAVAGLVIAVLSWFILNIIGQITGVELTIFSIPTLQ